MRTRSDDPARRRWLAAAAGALALPAGTSLFAADEPTGPEPPRLALLIGNRDYPDGEDLPPIHKNVRDLRAALEKRGFDVSDGLDADLGTARGLVDTFAAKVRAAPRDATVFFYFSGHGAQVDAENLLVSARVSPKARPDTLIKGSMTLTTDVLGRLPQRPQALTIAVVDACRTSLRNIAEGDGLNQVEAPPGCLIAFATGAGKPAIAPATDIRNTFYTESLVKLMATSSDEISFSDLFRLVKNDVPRTMLNFPVPAVRAFAQYPFIAENTQVRLRLAPRRADAPPPPPPKPDERQAWARLEEALWPGDVARLAAFYQQNFPASPLYASAQVALDGANDAAQILRRVDVKLYRSAFQGSEGGDRRSELAKAGRGDKDAAARVGRLYSPRGAAALLGRETTAANPNAGRYEGWMQYAAALGNGIASYDLALHYRRTDQPLLASQFEARARQLGYTPPPSLDNTRK